MFFGDHDGSAYALAEADGTKVWQATVSGSIDASVTVDAGTVYAAADRLSALDASNGVVRWTYDPAAGLPPLPFASFRFRQFNAQPSIDREFLYIGDMAGRLYKLRRSDGQLIWVAELGAGMVAPPILDERQVIVGTWGGSIAAVDRASGAPLWRYESKDEIDGQILSTGAHVIFGSHGFGPLTALDAKSGRYRGASFWSAGGMVACGRRSSDSHRQPERTVASRLGRWTKTADPGWQGDGFTDVPGWLCIRRVG